METLPPLLGWTPIGHTTYDPDEPAFLVDRVPPIPQEVVTRYSYPEQKAAAKVMQFSSYMDEAHSPGLLLESWKDCVGRTKVDTLVGTGISGAVAVVNLARDLGINYLIIRKPGVSTHSAEPAEGWLGKNWVFVDDLVSSGETIRRVWDTMNDIQADGFKTTFKGVFLYGNGDPRFLTPRYNRRRLHEWLAYAESYNKEFGTTPPEETAW